MNRAILSSSIYTEDSEIKRANVKFYIADAIGDQWLNSINHQFKVKICYAICKVSDAMELYKDFKFIHISQYYYTCSQEN